MTAILTARFWAKVDKTPTCWLWTGALNSKGYGQWGVNGVSKSVHRLAYEDVHGPIPAGLTIDHLCRVRPCCKPADLEAVTIQVNIARAPQSLKTHCLRGHALAASNLRVNRNGARSCRACARACNAAARLGVDVDAYLAEAS